MPQANSIQTPNVVGNFLNAFQAGTQTREAREKKNALSSIGQAAGSGDLAAARQQAFEAGEFGVAGQLQSSIDSADAKTLETAKVYNNDVARAAFAANSTEEWDAGIDRLAAQYPSRARELLAQKGQFSPEARERAINQALTIDQMIVRAEKGSKPLTLSRGQIAIDPSTGKEIARGLAPKPDAPQAVKNFIFPDGTRRAFRADDPRINEALEQGATVVGQQVTAGSFGDLKGNRADDIREEIGAVSSAREIVAKLRQDINENRSRGGAIGTIKGAAQTASGIALDVADALNFEGSNFLIDTARQVNEDLQQGAADAGVERFFDPSLPENTVRQNALAYALARARKGSGRLNQDDVENARRDVNITGLTSVDDVLARLGAIEEELSGAQSRFQDRLGGQTPGTTPVFEVRDGQLIRVE